MFAKMVSEGAMTPEDERLCEELERTGVGFVVGIAGQAASRIRELSAELMGPRYRCPQCGMVQIRTTLLYIAMLHFLTIGQLLAALSCVLLQTAYYCFERAARAQSPDATSPPASDGSQNADTPQTLPPRSSP